MRRVFLIGLVVASSLILVPPASAHDTCSAVAGIGTPSAGVVRANGGYRCGSTRHYITLKIALQRRIPGQGFSTFSSVTYPTTWTNMYNNWFDRTRSCRYDYRTLVTGTASPGGHQGSQASAILFHTC
jgi:hypothetical protein